MLSIQKEQDLLLDPLQKTLKRDLAGYRADLVHLAFKRLRKLHRFKKLNKRVNKSEAKKVKA